MQVAFSWGNFRQSNQLKFLLILEITVGTKIHSTGLSTTIHTWISDERTF
jgi:hypothetical protein